MPEEKTASVDDSAKESQEKFFDRFLAHLRIAGVKAVAEAYFENIRRIDCLVEMPFVIFGFLEVDDYRFRTFRSFVQEHWSLEANYGTVLEKYLLLPEFKVREHLPDFMERTQKRFQEALGNPTYGFFLRSSMQTVYSAAISTSWTSLECLASDLWVTSLNDYPLPLAQAALTALDPHEPGELNGKQISVGLAAKYGFDLRHSLGTLLKPKFDFTNVAGIQKAYKIFVPSDNFLQQLFSEPLLDELECTRHLIVHRASRVDEEYKKRIKSSLEIGTRLSFTEEQTSRFVHVGERTGFGLLAFVDDWIRERLAGGPS